MNPKDKAQELVAKFLKDIAEFADTGQVFLTFHDGETSSGYEKGFGNFYARQGQADEWLIIQRQYQKNEAIRRDNQP